MNARRYFVLTLLGAALFATPAVQAQEAGQAPQGEQGMHQLPQSAEKIARHQAKAMQKAVDLNEKQYDKIYSLYLKEENARRKQMTSQGGGGMMGGGPGMGGGPQGGPGMGGGRPQMSQNDAKTLEKQRQKREKKIKKILTAEQYEKWTSLQPAPGEGMPPQDGMRPGEGMPPRGEMPPMQQQDNVNE
jgi:Spy/CpxP family protein refolding chaperone